LVFAENRLMKNRLRQCGMGAPRHDDHAPLAAEFDIVATYTRSATAASRTPKPGMSSRPQAWQLQPAARLMATAGLFRYTSTIT